MRQRWGRLQGAREQLETEEWGWLEGPQIRGMGGAHS